MEKIEELPAHLVQRVDESDDTLFYANPRMVTHVDDGTIESLTRAYRELVPAGADILDSMSSWISHLPPEIEYGQVVGLGMNQAELAANPRLSESVVHDLNANPDLPFDEGSFDVVLNAFSIQYLTRPIQVFRSVADVLRPGGLFLVAVSHRVFPTKAIRVWQSLLPAQRPRLVEGYFEHSGGFATFEMIDHSPTGADPLWIVLGRKG